MTDLFNGQTPVQNEPVTPPSDYSAYLSLIRNEKGEQKYSSIEKALEALANTQSYIPHIKTENDTLKAQLEEAKSKLKAQEELEAQLQRLADAKAPQGDNRPAASGLTEEAVANLIKQQLEQTEQQKAVQTNREVVQKALTEKFGDKAKDAIASKAAELGMTTQALGDLASSAPQAVLKLFDTSAPKGVSVTSSSLVTPLQPPQEEALKYPERSLLVGATLQDQIAFMKKIEAGVHKQFGVTH